MIEQVLFGVYIFGVGIVGGMVISDVADGARVDYATAIITMLLWPVIIPYLNISKCLRNT